jgi:uncharacterized protein
MTGSTAARLLIEARHRAGLSQRALARRARTAQSVVARIESGTASPSWETLERLLRGAGFALSASLVRPQDPQDAVVLREMLKRQDGKRS